MPSGLLSCFHAGTVSEVSPDNAGRGGQLKVEAYLTNWQLSEVFQEAPRGAK